MGYDGLVERPSAWGVVMEREREIQAPLLCGACAREAPIPKWCRTQVEHVRHLGGQGGG